MLRRHRAAHRAIWLGLALLLPAILVLGLWAREPRPGEAPVRLAPPAGAPS